MSKAGIKEQIEKYNIRVSDELTIEDARKLLRTLVSCGTNTVPQTEQTESNQKAVIMNCKREFQYGRDNWVTEQLEELFIANDVVLTEKNRTILLCEIDEETYDLVSKLCVQINLKKKHSNKFLN